MDPFFYLSINNSTDDPDLYDYDLWEAYSSFGSQETSDVQSVPYQNKYDAVLQDYPWLKNDHPRNHCQGTAQYFTDQILIVPEDKQLLSIYDPPQISGGEKGR